MSLIQYTPLLPLPTLGMLCDGVFMNLLLVSYPSVRQLIYEVLLAYGGGSQLSTPSNNASGNAFLST